MKDPKETQCIHIGRNRKANASVMRVEKAMARRAQVVRSTKDDHTPDRPSLDAVFYAASSGNLNGQLRMLAAKFYL